MAHELDDNLATGKKAMFAVVKTEADTPWHREGFYCSEPPKSIKHGMELAGNGFTVIEQPLFLYDKELGYVKMNDYKAIVREDTGLIMQVSSKDYPILQGYEAFECLEPLVDKGIITLDTGGSIREGRQVWMMGKLNFQDPVVNEVFDSLGLKKHIMVTTGHDGLHGPEIGATSVRTVCANTLAIARMDLVKLRHRGDVRTRLVQQAEEMFAAVIERYQDMAVRYKAMKERILTVEEFTKGILDKIAPLPAITKPEDTCTRGYISQETKRDAFTYKWENGKGHTGDHSAWEAYNGVIEVIDHNETIFRVNKGGSRVGQLLGGRLEAKKDEALNCIMAIVKR